MHTLLIAAALVVSLRPLQAQGNFAKVVVQSGRVSFIKDASGYSWALMDDSQVKPGYTIKTGPDGYAKLQVSDGSTFEVFPNSEVVFRKTNSIGDLLNVWLGRVKVMIQHAPGIPNPNNVTTPTALISVRGTIFDVDVQDEDGTTFVTLDEGIVDVHHRVQPSSRDVRLSPGQAVTVYRDQPLARLGMDKGNLLRNGLKALQRGVLDAVYNRPGGVGGGTVPTTTGKQGDQGKNTGNGTGNGAPGNPPPGNGAPPNPPPPPPGGGGG